MWVNNVCGRKMSLVGGTQCSTTLHPVAHQDSSSKVEVGCAIISEAEQIQRLCAMLHAASPQERPLVQVEHEPHPRQFFFPDSL